MGKKSVSDNFLALFPNKRPQTFQPLLLTDYHQLVAKLQGKFRRGGQVDATPADAGNGATESTHQVQIAQLLVYHILVGKEQRDYLMRVLQRQFAFLAHAHQRSQLVQGFLTAHRLQVVTFVQHGLRRRDGNLPVMLQPRDDRPRHGTGIDLRQAAPENHGVRHPEDAGRQLRIFPPALFLQLAGLLRQVDMQYSGQLA